jgi:hypothetical protein
MANLRTYSTAQMLRDDQPTPFDVLTFRQVVSSGKVYGWNPTSSATDDGTDTSPVLKPTTSSLAGGVGRYEEKTSGEAIEVVSALRANTSTIDFNAVQLANAATPSRNAVLAGGSQVATQAYVDQTSTRDLSSPTFASWTINATTGDDNAANGGTLKTAAQWARRMGGQAIPIAMTIAQQTDIGTADRWNFTGISTDEAGSVTVDGSTGVVVASELTAFTAVQNINLANPTDCAQYATVSGQVWASVIDKQVRIKAGGSNPGAISYPDTDMTGGQARFAPFILNPTFNSSNVNPIVGDVIQIVTLPKARNLIVSGMNQNLNFRNLDFDDQDGFGHVLGGGGFSAVTFISCITRGFFFYTQGLSFYHCQITGLLIAGSSSGTPSCIICGGHFVGGASSVQMPHISIDNHALFRATNIRIFGNSGALMPSIGKVGVYGVAAGAGAVVAAQNAVVLFGNSLSGTSAIYGTAGYNTEARSYGRVFYDPSQGEANIFKVSTSSAKYKQGATNQAGPLPLAPDASLNSIVAWT